MNLSHSEVIDLASLFHLLTAAKPGATWQIVPFPLERKAIDIGDCYSNHSLASELLHWQPQLLLDVGLARTLVYYHHNLPASL